MDVTLPTNLSGGSCVFYNGKIYIFGGYYYPSGSSSNSTVNRSLLIFDPSTETISSVDLNRNRYASRISASLVGDSVYLLALGAVSRYDFTFDLERDRVLITSTAKNRVFKIITNDSILEIGIDRVYIGDIDGKAK